MLTLKKIKINNFRMFLSFFTFKLDESLMFHADSLNLGKKRKNIVNFFNGKRKWRNFFFFFFFKLS